MLYSKKYNAYIFTLCISSKLWLKLYTSIIVPILSYSSEIWISDFKANPNNFDKISWEKILKFILRNILGVHNKASNLATKLELGVFHIHIKMYQFNNKYYSRMENFIKSNDYHNVLITRNVYLEGKQLYIENKKCWLFIKSLQRLLNVKFDTECKKLGPRLENFFENDFFFLLNFNFNFNRIMFSVISSHYTLYSTSFNYDDKKLEIQQYLCLPLPKNLVSYLTKFRISAHLLYV